MTWLQRTFAFLQIFGISVGQARAEIAESWEIYFLQVNSVPSTIAVDLGLREAAPIAKLPQLLWVTIALNEPNQPNGMQSAAEQPTLIKIDEAIISAMKECPTARHVGRLTGGGRRILYFYAAECARLDEIAAKAMAQFPSYRFKAGQTHEPTWSTYIEHLYPERHSMRQISNRHLFDVIEKSIANDGSAREIDHFAFFKTAEGRRKFVEEVTAEKFEIAEEMPKKKGAPDGFPYGVHFQRTDVLRRDVIEGVTWKLEDLAAKHEGMYDGWGAMAGRRR